MSSRPIQSLLLVILAVGCNNAAANGPERLQGVVEYEDRVLGLEVGGRVSVVEVRRGDRIVPNTVLLRIDDEMERPVREARAAEVEIARAQLRLLESGARPEEVRGAQVEMAGVGNQLALLRRQADRQRQLVAGGAAPAAALDQLQSQIASLSGHRAMLEQRVRALREGARPEEIEAARARVQSVEAGLAAVDARLSRFILRTPEPGFVTDIHVDSGEIAAPGAPAVTIADLDHPYVDVFVSQARISQVRVGLDVRVSVDGVAQQLRGRVEHVFPRPEFTPRFLFSEEERPNIVIRVRVRIHDPEHVVHAGIPAFVEVVGGGN
ncbi:MAG: HlyD family efflux transporter periplasmic adaptor subunit [Polyangiaceae bacterium]|nr:HlyD family efflux transporter periplasmic adaptor subunit [Polyangiaceae bacterium]